MKLVAAIDQGTTGTTVIVLDSAMKLRARVTREVPQIYPRPGWVEHDPEVIWQTVLSALAEALHECGAGRRNLVAFGITNQRETTVLWDRQSGRPVHQAIVWQDRRTADLCDRLKAEGKEALFRERTGLLLDPYFSGTKIRWLLDEIPGLRARAARGEVAFGTIDSWLVHRLSGGRAHVTDVSNASRTLLLDLARLGWDDELCAALQVPREMLPDVCSSAEVYTETRGATGIPDGVPVAGIAGDQQAALFGQVCLEAGETKCTYGTGAFILMNIGEKPVASRHGLITTVAWRIGGQVRYALEGSAFVAGAAVQWLRDGLGVIERASDIEALARQVPDSGGVVVVPAFTGLGAPHWRPAARGLVTGLTRGSTRAHLARATLEAIALQVHDLIEAMAGDAGRRASSLKVDGGASANDLLMQMQADLSDLEIVRPAMIETTALGAALLAGLGAGLWSSADEVRGLWNEEARFRPAMPRTEAQALIDRWRLALPRA